MNAVPLSDPSGALRAWMCGCCGHVGHGGESMYRNADEHIIKASKARAESCCVCRTCGAPNPRADSVSALHCRACSAKQQAALDAARAEWEKTRKPCDECDGSGYDERDGDCDACSGSGWSPMEITLDQLKTIIGGGG